MDSLRESLSLLDKKHRFLLGVLGAASFFEGYDFNIITIALPQIRATFGIDQAQASRWISLIFLGALPAVFVTRRADLHGRRRLLLISITGYTIATGLTALAPTITAFTGLQFAARVFLAAEGAIVWTMVAEDLPAGARGLGFGWLAMLNALGFGFGSIAYGVILEPNNISWRWMYAIAVPPLLGMAWVRRRLPESKRFEAARAVGRLADHWHRILRPPHRKWLFLICLTAFLGSLTTQVTVFLVDFMHTDRGQSTRAANLIVVLAGAAGIPVLTWAGSLSDRYGRKIVGCSFAALAVLGSVGFFFLPGGKPVLFTTLLIALVGNFGAWPTLGSFNSELFPTALRGQAGSWATVFRVAGQSSSLALTGLLIDSLRFDLPYTVLALGAGPVITVIIIATLFPETSGRELEEITGEPGFSGPREVDLSDVETARPPGSMPVSAPADEAPAPSSA